MKKKQSANSQFYKAIAEYYDAEYENSEMLQRDVPFLFAHLPRKSLKILELCTGTARAAIPLAQAGHKVTGIDYDPALLAIARHKRDTIAIPEKNLKLVKANALSLKLNEKYDLAFLIFNSFLNFTTLDEQRKLLSNVTRHLKKGGKFWIDIFNPDLSILAEEYHALYDSNTFYVPALDRSVHRTTELIRSKDRLQLTKVIYHYTYASSMGEVVTDDVKFEMTWMFPRELKLLLESVGFEITHMYGDYDGSAITPESPRIIMMAKKI